MIWMIWLACQAQTAKESQPQSAVPLIQFVDPLIGTGGIGYEVGCSYPGAAMPFGMVKLSPDTSDTYGLAAGFYRGGGYHYDDVHIEGFSHLHLQGTGITDYGIIATMPIDGLSIEQTTRAGYRQAFSHETETAEPGYYAVQLPSAEVQLTVTPRTGLHQYQFSTDNSDPHLVLDLGHGLGNGRVLEASANYVEEDNAWQGSVHYDGEMSEPFWMHFYMRFEEAPIDWGYWQDSDWSETAIDAAAEEGVHAGIWFQFPENSTAQMRLALSAVSQEGAHLNWLAEHDGWSFEDERTSAFSTWEALFDRITIRGGTEAEHVQFASALYRSMLMPNLFSDADGRYFGFDGQIRQNPSRKFYTDFSLWDSYRTTHSLYTLLVPEIHQDLLWSLARMSIEGQGLPRWPLGSYDSETMLGTPANIVLGEAYAKGLRGFDEAQFTPLAVQMIAGELDMNFGGPPIPETYGSLGFYPYEEVGRSVAWIQESSVSDFALQHLARDFVDSATADWLDERGHWFEKNYDPDQGFFVGLMQNGTFTSLESESAWDELYAEGNARQYLWMAPHAPEHLIDVIGGPETAIERLDEMFEGAVDEDVNYLGLPKPWYWHGNEPSLHIPWLYAMAGAPELTDEWVRWALTSQYSNTPDGLPGNDDGGTMSAWSVLAAIGIYPIVGTDRYILSPPLFSEIEIDSGVRKIQISHSHSAQRSLWLNGEQWDKADANHRDLLELQWFSPLAP